MKMRSMRRAALWLCLQSGVLAIAAACGGAEVDATDSAEIQMTVGPENIAVVTGGMLETGPVISGTLVPEQQATLRAEVSAAVLAISAEQGQRVARGEQLARLDDAAIEDAFISARSALAAAENSAAVATREAERAAALAAAGAIAQRDLDQANRASAAAAAQLSDAKARLALAEKQRNATRIVAPFAGVVNERHVAAGDLVQPGAALFSIVDPASMRLEATVPAADLELVKVGAPVRFNVSGYSARSFSGRVTRVNPVADPATRQVRIYVSIPNAAQTLVGGLFAEGRVISDARDAMIAPAAAVNMTGATPTVTRMRGGLVELVQVQVGMRNDADETVELISGVVAGDTLLMGAAQGITPGTAVRLSRPSETAGPGSGGGD